MDIPVVKISRRLVDVSATQIVCCSVVCVLALCCTTFSITAFAQMGTAIVSGRVTDEQSAAIADAQVVITNIDTNQTIAQTTNTDALYTTRIMHVVGI